MYRIVLLFIKIKTEISVVGYVFNALDDTDSSTVSPISDAREPESEVPCSVLVN